MDGYFGAAFRDRDDRRGEVGRPEPAAGAIGEAKALGGNAEEPTAQHAVGVGVMNGRHRPIARRQVRKDQAHGADPRRRGGADAPTIGEGGGIVEQGDPHLSLVGSHIGDGNGEFGGGGARRQKGETGGETMQGVHLDKAPVVAMPEVSPSFGPDGKVLFGYGCGSFANGIREASTTRYAGMMRNGTSPWPSRLIYYVAAPIMVGAVLATIGPFGTFGELSGAARLFYWTILVCAGWWLVDGTIRLLGHLRPGLPEWGRAALACPPAAAAVSAIVLLLEARLRPALDIEFLWLYPRVLVMTAAITVPVVASRFHRVAAGAPGLRPDQPAASGEDTPAASFLARLPPELGTDILCLEMEDHYLRVHTRLGDALLLMRLRDADAELSPAVGRRVHRSWWVARSAVCKAHRRSGRVALELADGREVPVGRSYVAALREEGWLP